MTPEWRPIDALIREKGITGKYGVFFCTGEGRMLPGGDEESSGFVIDQRGRCYSFWTTWSRRHNKLAMARWERVAIEPEWHSNTEYQRARAAAGLD